MNFITHTQGKWTVDSELRIYGERKDGCPIGKVFNEFIDYDEAQANARLICSAPNLLEALKLALQDLTGDYEDTEANRQATIETIKSAIQSSEGN